MGVPSWMGGSSSAGLGERQESPKLIIRCSSCRLVQFETRSGSCRRCEQPLPLPQATRVARLSEGVVSRVHPTAMRADGAGKVSRREWSAGLRQAVARRTRERRMELGVSQVKFARMLGIPRSYLSRVENEHLLPGPAMLARLAQYLGVEFHSMWESYRDSSAQTDEKAAEILATARHLSLPGLAQAVRFARQSAQQNHSALQSAMRNVA